MAERPVKSIDWATLSLYIALVGIGWLSIFTVGYGDGYPSNLRTFLFETEVGKQTLWIGAAIILFFFIYIIERNFWQTFAWALYGVSILSLILVLLVGKEINGARSWFAFGGFTIQPSELVKFTTCLVVAAYVSRYETNLKQFRHQVVSIGLFSIPMALILLQPDAGSALVFLSFFILLYREGFPAGFFLLGFLAAALLILALKYDPTYIVPILMVGGCLAVFTQFRRQRPWIIPALLLVGLTLFALYRFPGPAVSGAATGLAIVTAIGFYIRRKNAFGLRLLPILIVGALLVYGADYAMNEVLQPHQQSRINAWLNTAKAEQQGSLYNLVQSKMAIGSGGLMGKGFLEGSLTKGNFVPAQSTDFIFCTIGEEQGFVGSASIILIFLFFILRLLTLAERQRYAFGRAFGYGVAGIFFLHFFINIGMTMGLVPIIGIPLPFISKGGSGLLGFTLLVAVLLKIDRYR